MGEVTKVQAEPVTKELLDEDGVPIMQYALAVPQGFGGDDGVTAWLGPERAPPLPLPELIPGDEADDPAFAAWLRAAPLAPRWVKSERDFLDLVRSECREELARAPPYPEAYGERRLLRFLRQHKKADKALAAVKQRAPRPFSTYLAYRRENGLDEILAFLRKGDVPQSGWPLGDFFKDRLAVCPCSTSLFDVKGNALCVEQYGFWPAHRLRDVTAEGYIAWQTYALEFKSMQLERIALGRSGDTTHFVNASMAVSTFFAYLRPLLPKHTQRKIYIHGLGPQARSRRIRPDFLPRRSARGVPGPGAAADLRGVRRARRRGRRGPGDGDGGGGVARRRAARRVRRRPADPPRIRPARDANARGAPAAEAPRPPPPAAGGETARREPGTMVPGIEIPVHKHGRRGRAERSLRLDPGEELQILPAKKWRLLKKTRRLRIAEDLSAWRGSRTHGAKPPEGPRPRTQLQRDASLRASQYPPNFVILATDKGKLVTLELATEHQAEALVHAIKPARRA
ncbi:hypothetical protein JL721_7873 [Aureococcus anophagefferens]|nr:hypothetical protein JL721_7873 [Aureococcus anophagefferens]